MIEYTAETAGQNTKVTLNNTEIFCVDECQLNEKGLLDDYRIAKVRVKTIIVNGPYLSYLMSIQSPAYIAGKFIIVANQMRLMASAGLSQRELEFLNKFWSGCVVATLRHGCRPRLEQNPRNSGTFKIPWHRDSNQFGEQKGFLVSGMYIRRPANIFPNSGGIAFIKGNKQVDIFPTPKTVVTFFDQYVIHKVIPPKVTSSEDTSYGFVQRSAIFMSWLTTDAKIKTHLNLANINAQPFLKPGIKSSIRNLKELYKILTQYFKYIHRMMRTDLRYQTMSIDEFLNRATNNHIDIVYKGTQGTNSNNHAAWAALKVHTPSNLTVANSVLYNMYTNRTHTNRIKLQRLYSVYKELAEHFQGGSRRGGRIMVTPENSGFVEVL
jgi:hypothetical protein